jgi:hypothetical protein
LAGQPLTTGYDPYGYNYQAHMFGGSYFNAYANGDNFPPYEGDDAVYLAANPTAAGHWAWPYRDVDVIMKWNDAWLSNKDCNGDGLLDRPDDFGGTYIGSGAWETNHMSSTYMDPSTGKECHWTDFYKIIAVPADAQQIGGIWFDANGTEIGAVLWGAFATIQEVYNDTCAGYHGILFRSPAGPGFGKYRQ